MFQLIYASRPVGFDPNVVLNILTTARKKNAALDITGGLLFREDVYLQMLEGQQDTVSKVFDSILHDPRHRQVTELVARKTAARMFGKWTMRGEPARPDIWSPDNLNGGPVPPDMAADALALFTRFAAFRPRVVAGQPDQGFPANV